VVAYRIDGMQGPRTPSNSQMASAPPRTIAEYIAETRMATNENQHPIAVFDPDGQPVFRNSALASRLSAEQQNQTSDRTWHLAFAAACRIFSEAMAGPGSVSTLIPVRQRLFVVLGSLLRQASGTVYGGTLHITEVTGNVPETSPVQSGSTVSGTVRTDEGNDAYMAWMQRRDEARSRMQRLSPRETEVVARVSAGLPNKSIACELEISVKTIEKHRANAVRKLGVQSTPEMVRIAVLADEIPDAAVPTLTTSATVPREFTSFHTPVN